MPEVYDFEALNAWPMLVVAILDEAAYARRGPNHDPEFYWVPELVNVSENRNLIKEVKILLGSSWPCF